jgi:amino acid adenylation domain-containing protein
MSPLTDLLHDLLVQGAELSIDDGKLRVRAREGVLTPRSLETLRDHKDQILRLLPEYRFEAPLSADQEGMWFLQQTAPDSIAYNVSFSLQIESEDDHRPALRWALQKLVDRHALLRTSYAAVDGRPRQIVHGHRGIERLLVEADAERLSPAEVLDAVAEIQQRPFDLAAEGAARICLLRRGPRESVLVFCVHHIAIDGWSMYLVLDELLRLYAAAGAPNPLPPLEQTYQQFVAWQQELLTAHGEELRRAWLDELAGAPLVLRLPTDRARPAAQTFRGATLRRQLAPALVDRLRALARSQSTTLSTILLAAYQILLHRYSGQDDLCVGFGVARRDREELAATFGYMVNQLVIRSRLGAEDAPGFLSLIQETRARVMTALSRQDYPFPWLVKDLLADRDPSRPPLVQAALVYQRAQALGDAAATLLGGASAVVRGARWTALPASRETSEIDLTLEVTEYTADLGIGFRYNSDLFDAATIDRMAGHLEHLLGEIAADPGRPAGQLPLLPEAERHQLVVEWNRTEAPFSSEACIHELFEAHADRAPDAPALVDLCDPAAGPRGVTVTYGELDRRANRIAHHLIRLGVGPEVRVGVCLPRGADLIAAVLGVLKAGGASVVLDPEHPRRHLAFLLEDTGVPVVLTQRAARAALPETDARVVELDHALGDELAHRPARRASATCLAHVLYTSGSTGRPNGALIEHRGLVNSIEAHVRVMETGPDTRHAHVLSFNFDAAFAHLFDTICAGGAVYLVPRDGELLGGGLIELMAREAITHISLVPSMLAALPDAELPALRTIVVGGERCPAALVTRWGRARRLLNLYGPTEASILATAARCVADGTPPPIGRPIQNLQAYVVDRHGQLAPLGVTGELWLGGAGVARGYLNRPELTAQKFIDSPFGPGRLYRTGDLVRYRAASSGPPVLEFVGRADTQVKLRGQRVELGEVESALRASSRVRDAVATVHEPGGANPRLVAYVTPARVAPPEQWELEQVDAWSAISGELDRELGDDLTGWKSSYTGQDLPRDEMLAWAESTVARILELAPREVLEIGCGSGLLLTRIAPRVQRYRGTDLSRHAVERVELLKRKRGDLANVTVSQQPAHDLTGLTGQRFDTVILNSVVQYFPSVGYLRRVLEGLLGLLRPGGAIFVGDVRNLALLETFHAAVERARGDGTSNRQELRGRVQRAMIDENELVVHPRFFTALRGASPQITGVEIAPKRGAYRNELSLFRYDVTLRVGASAPESSAPPPTPQIEWRPAGTEDPTLAELREWIVRAGPARAIGVREIPNARLQEDNAWRRWLTSAGEDAHLPWRTPPQDPRALDPEALYALEAELPCRIVLSWAAGHPDGSLDAIVTTGELPAPRFPLDPPGGAALHGDELANDLANDPLLGRRYRALATDLGRELREALPPHLVPSAIVVLPALPLTLNGKVDVRALPPPEQAQRTPGEPTAPETETERQLAAIWRELLGVSHVSAHDNFFALGGHSLLALALVARVKAELGRSISIATLFEAPTLRELARRLDASETGAARVHPLLLPIQTQGDRTPVFCVGAVTESASYLHVLASGLGDDQPLYGVQFLGLEEELPDAARMEDLGERFADLIQEIQPRGPYILSGHSAGGRLALVIAFTLEARGHRTALAVIDVSAPVVRKIGRPDESLIGYVRLLRQTHDAKQPAAAAGDSFDLDLEAVAQLPEGDPQTWQRIAALLQRRHLLPSGDGVDLLRRLLQIRKRAYQLMDAYAAEEPYRGHLMFLSEAGDPAIGRSQDWQKICAHPVQTLVVPGDHFSMLREPHVGVIAAHLRRLVDEHGRTERAAPFPVSWDSPEDARAMWIFDAAHSPAPMSPLDFDLRMRPMAAATGWANELYRVPLGSEPRLINGFVYQKVTDVDVPPEAIPALLRESDAAVRRVAGELSIRWETTWLPAIQGHLAALAILAAPGAVLPVLLEQLAEARRRVARLWEVHFELLSPVLVALADFEEAYRELFPDASPLDAHDLLAGFPNKTVEANLRLWELGRAAARTPALRAAILDHAPADLPAVLARSPEGTALWGEICDYVKRYGERNDDLYLDTPTWIEDPTPVLRGLREAVLQPERDLAAELQQQAARRDARLASVRAQLASHPRPVVEELEALVKAAQVSTVLSEDHNFWLDTKITYHLRRVTLEIGHRLVERGDLERPGDVFHLTLAELTAEGAPAAAAPSLRDQVAQRRTEAAHAAGMTPPAVLGVLRPVLPIDCAILRAGSRFNGDFTTAPRAPGELGGMPGSRGKVTGPARIVRTLAEAVKLRPGDVLVAPATLPSWTSCFAVAAAVVTDVGGVLCHAAVVAREYGIPAVVGARGATAALRDGQLVEVDGDAGIVRAIP